MTDVRLSIVLNTAALDPRIGGRSNPHRRSQYADRERLLREEILPAVREQQWDEILVVGQWEEGEGYRYIEMEPRYRDRRDALWQRALGFRHSVGDVVVFAHDDHRPAYGFPDTLRSHYKNFEWDILCPRRVHNVTGEELNNGHPKFSDQDGRPSEFYEEGYIGSHVLPMKRWVPATIPWTSVNLEHWDTILTSMWREAGANIRYSSDLVHIDLEVAKEEK